MIDDNKLKLYLRERLNNYERSVDDALWLSFSKEIGKRNRRKRIRLYAVGVAAAMVILALLLPPILRESDDTVMLALQEVTSVKEPSKDNFPIPDKIETERQPESTPKHQTVVAPSHKQDAIVDIQIITDTKKAVEEPENYKAAEPEGNREMIAERDVPISHDAKSNLYKLQPAKKQDNQKRGLSLLLATNREGSINYTKKPTDFRPEPNPEKPIIGDKDGINFNPEPDPEKPIIGDKDPIDSRPEPDPEKPIIGNDENISYNPLVSYGIKVRKRVSDHFAIESGLTYTYLHAHIAKTMNDVKLHYIGIPLKGVYIISDGRRLSFYGSMGGMVEKQVYGIMKHPRTGETILKNPNLQWSLSASAGINYRLAGFVGLFAEPGISYFFDDGSNIPTIHKDKPLNFSFQIGLSFNIE